MANLLQLIAGAAVKDGTLEDNQGLKFVDDGANNTGGWILYLSVDVKGLNTTILRLLFFDNNDGNAGNAEFILEYRAINEITSAIASGSVSFTIPISGASNDLLYSDVDISSWFLSSDTHIELTLGRDSSNPLDTVASDIFFFNGHTIEV